jgi:hypothetical protein
VKVFAIIKDEKVVRTGSCSPEVFALQANENGEVVHELERHVAPEACEFVNGEVKIKDV